MNRGFIHGQLPAEAGFDHRDVVSLLMFRAHNGGGLTRPLQAHADGTALITGPRGLLVRHMYWAAGECRNSAWARREIATDWADTPAYALTAAKDSDGNVSGHLELIDILSAECEDVIADDRKLDPQHEQLLAVQHIIDRLPALWAIFRRYAPEAVTAEVAAWDEDSRACVLLALFPVQLPHRAVTIFRQLAMTVGSEAVTASATQRKISRLRVRLREIWPPELAPPGIKIAGYPIGSNTGGEEAP